MTTSSTDTLTLEHVESLLTTLAADHARAQRLVVDYYRIRRQLAWPLPVMFEGEPDIPTRLGSTYPWSIWLMWSLEQRVNALAWSANRGGKDAKQHARLANDDLAAITRWPVHAGHPQPDLMLGHVARLIAKAHAHWSWVAPSLRDELALLCKKLAHQWYDWTAKNLNERLAGSYPIANIPLIGMLGVLQAGYIADDAKTMTLREPLEALLRKWLNHFGEGYTEGVAYDGYIWDHAVDCLSLVHKGKLPDWLINHPQLSRMLENSYELACPGKMEHVAEIGDVEPLEMPFHLSVHVKLLDQEKLCPQSRWLLERVDLSWLRVDGLAMLHTRLTADAPLPVSAAPARDKQQVRQSTAVYTQSLRSGWEANDLAVVLPCSRSLAGHLHMDAGHMVLGTRGQWLISDPGYQQYLQTTERTFTLGAGAHNNPVICGKTQVTRGAARAVVHPDADCLCVDTTACYQDAEGEVEAQANQDSSRNGLSRVLRCVWMLDASLVVVADDIQGSILQQEGQGGSVQWFWHGCPAGAWWVQNGQATLHVAPDITLHLSSPNSPITLAMLDRLPGSRGQQTISVRRPLTPANAHDTHDALDALDAQRLTQWWLFAIDPTVTPETQITHDGLSIGSRLLRIPGR